MLDQVSMTGPRSITQLLIEWGDGNRSVLDELTPRVYRELHALARSYLSRSYRHHTLQPTELINEVYLRLIDRPQSVKWENRSHFFGIAARLMRLVLVDHARSRHAAKRGGEAGAITLQETEAFTAGPEPDVLEVDEALSRLAEFDERKAKVVELRYFGGMNREEIATALGLTVPTVKRDLRLAEAWLRRYLSGNKG